MGEDQPRCVIHQSNHQTKPIEVNQPTSSSSSSSWMWDTNASQNKNEKDQEENDDKLDTDKQQQQQPLPKLQHSQLPQEGEEKKDDTMMIGLPFVMQKPPRHPPTTPTNNTCSTSDNATKAPSRMATPLPGLKAPPLLVRTTSEQQDVDASAGSTVAAATAATATSTTSTTAPPSPLVVTPLLEIDPMTTTNLNEGVLCLKPPRRTSSPLLGLMPHSHVPSIDSLDVSTVMDVANNEQELHNHQEEEEQQQQQEQESNHMDYPETNNSNNMDHGHDGSYTNFADVDHDADTLPSFHSITPTCIMTVGQSGGTLPRTLTPMPQTTLKHVMTRMTTTTTTSSKPWNTNHLVDKEQTETDTTHSIKDEHHNKNKNKDATGNQIYQKEKDMKDTLEHDEDDTDNNENNMEQDQEQQQQQEYELGEEQKLIPSMRPEPETCNRNDPRRTYTPLPGRTRAKSPLIDMSVKAREPLTLADIDSVPGVYVEGSIPVEDTVTAVVAEEPVTRKEDDKEGSTIEEGPEGTSFNGNFFREPSEENHSANEEIDVVKDEDSLDVIDAVKQSEGQCTDDGSEEQHSSRKITSKAVKGLPRELSIQDHAGEDDDITLHPTSDAWKEVTSHPVVDAFGERGLYTGSLDPKSHVPDGYGIMQYRQGRIYEGFWQQGHWHGTGKCTNAMGDVYVGEFVLDKKEGKGTLLFFDGREFTGRFQKDQMREGTLYFQDGSYYQGMLRNGKRNGFGLYVFNDRSQYEGQWEDDKMHGRGKMEWSDGGWYNGDWEHGIQHGIGTEVLPDRTLRHNGRWEHGDPVNETPF